MTTQKKNTEWMTIPWIQWTRLSPPSPDGRQIKTPFDLLQEQYWPDRWKMAVVCIFLNCTTRSAAEPIVRTFFDKWPDEHSYIFQFERDRTTISSLIAPLGFKNRRAERIYKFSLDYRLDMRDISECHGIGEYALASDKMFYWEELSPNPPRDGVLSNVWKWIISNNERI